MGSETVISPVPANPPVNTPAWLDKSLWVCVLTPILLFVNAKFGTGLDAATIAGIVIPVLLYVVTHQWSKTKKSIAVYEANTPTAINK